MVLMKFALQQKQNTSVEDAVFQIDQTSNCAFQISYKHIDAYPDIHKFMKSKIRVHKQSKFMEIEEWYKRIDGSTSIYHPEEEQTTKHTYNIELFLKQSLLFKDERLRVYSHKLFQNIEGVLEDFSDIMKHDPKYSFLAFTPVISGSMREQTKTFCPNEFDSTLVLKHIRGLEIESKENSSKFSACE